MSTRSSDERSLDGIIFPDNENGWIKLNSARYNNLQSNVIQVYYPRLIASDQKILTNGLASVLNMIKLRIAVSSDEAFENQLTQQSNRDYRAILGIMLPFIDDDEFDTKKKNLTRLSDLYTATDPKGKFYFTNSQYNRCVRYSSKEQGNIIGTHLRPYLPEYFEVHLRLLLSSIHASANKLYVNWIDVLPESMDTYKTSELYSQSKEKFQNEITMFDSHIDLDQGLTLQDFYNIVANHLYNEIVAIKWIIFDLKSGSDLITYLSLLESKINFDTFWSQTPWIQVPLNAQTKFEQQWIQMLNSTDPLDEEFLTKFFYFFAKYHINARQLIASKQMILSRAYNLDLNDDDVIETQRITPTLTSDAKLGLKNVPASEIYLFFYNQLSLFKKTWYYYQIKISKNKLPNGITIKNIYNYAKSLCHVTFTVTKSDGSSESIYETMPMQWRSLDLDLVDLVKSRLMDQDTEWFNIKGYVRKFYQGSNQSVDEINSKIGQILRNNIIDYVFESGIYHGLFSIMIPKSEISNADLIKNSLGTEDRNKIIDFQRTQIKKFNMKSSYATEAYYWLTGQPYGTLSDKRPKGNMTFLESISDPDQRWTFTYAMNWVSQLNFYHHYLHDRVIYVTGSTGVGKSTQTPKLLMYSQKMLDFKSNGKIICTQPREAPTIGNAKTISRELGVSILEYSETYKKEIPSSNFYVQFKYQKDSHMIQNDSFLRLVTDGTLLSDLTRYPLLCSQESDPNAKAYDKVTKPFVKKFYPGNIYDIVIVDEAHEHNTNMDLILTLMRDIAYLNNSLKLVIVSATMDDDEPIYRRYYRNINDNLTYPLSMHIALNNLDRANMDRRIHISPPGETTQYKIIDHYLSKLDSDKINKNNFVDVGIEKAIDLANQTIGPKRQDIILFLSGQDDIRRAVEELNQNTRADTIAVGFYSDLPEDEKDFVGNIDTRLESYTKSKDPESSTKVLPGTYKRAIIVATNVAEASITLKTLKFVIDMGYAKYALFDPVLGVTTIETLPISQSSATQRKGRVGRVDSGEVYHMYDREKIANNKTAYGIANSDVKNNLLNLLKADISDAIIITNDNDPSNLQVLSFIAESNQRSNGEVLPLEFRLRLNPVPHSALIARQYQLFPDPNVADYYYTYFGKGSINNETSNLSVNLDYFRENHDDYGYQVNLVFNSRAYTGYDSFILCDFDHSFFIISPDENLLIRNSLTGQVIGLKTSPYVSDQYVYFILSENGLFAQQTQQQQNTNTEISTLVLDPNFKYKISRFDEILNQANQQLLVSKVRPELATIAVYYSNLTNEEINSVIGFYGNIMSKTYSKNVLYVKSALLEKLSDQQSLSQAFDYDANFSLWYTYAMAKDLTDDVVGVYSVMSVASIVTRLASDPVKFLSIHGNVRGDIYFAWKLWSELKEFVYAKNLVPAQRTFTNQIDLLQKKSAYVQQKLPLEQFLVLDKLYKTQQLNLQSPATEAEKASILRMRDTTNLQTLDSKTDLLLKIFAEERAIKPDLLISIWKKYQNSTRILTKEATLNDLLIKGKTTALTQSEQKSLDDLLWLKTHLNIPDVIVGQNLSLQDKKWARLLETYIRTYGYNFAKNVGSAYLDVVHREFLEPNFLKRTAIQTTTLMPLTQYIIYHTSNIPGAPNSPTYLTAVKIEWVMDLNPILFFSIIYKKRNELLRSRLQILADRQVDQIVNFELKPKYTIDSVHKYISTYGDPVYAKMINDNVLYLIEN
jgi:hypothetical protein